MVIQIRLNMLERKYNISANTILVNAKINKLRCDETIYTTIHIPKSIFLKLPIELISEYLYLVFSLEIQNRLAPTSNECYPKKTMLLNFNRDNCIFLI